ncbi:hypothetical protein BJY16_006986 [Actinoplanes octamycinicus]|uniref:Uncharacterized protein n=1 Tax=Actinoplanes octamycinicus TaxID=135948 RepID=A0A7W7H4J5_9ACTN|nr:hypothetical protein [Actinoplanes octamycinicus]
MDRRTAVRLDGRAVRQELAGVLENDDAVAEQAPALFAEGRHGLGGFAIDGIGWRAGDSVLAHLGFTPVGGCVKAHKVGLERYLRSNENGSLR